MANLVYLLLLIGTIIAAIGVFMIITYLNEKYIITHSNLGFILLELCGVIFTVVIMTCVFYAILNIKETYKVIDVKDNGFYSQEILIEDDDSTYLLKDISGEYEVGDEIKLSVIYVEQNGDKIN